VIRRFLGVWTLIVKTLGLVSWMKLVRMRTNNYSVSR